MKVNQLLEVDKEKEKKGRDYFQVLSSRMKKKGFEFEVRQVPYSSTLIIKCIKSPNGING